MTGADALPRWVTSAIGRLAQVLEVAGDAPTDPDALGLWLYGRWYLGGFAPTKPGEGEPPERLVARIRAALPEGGLESGWTLVRELPELGPGTIEAQKDGASKILSPLDYLPDGPPLARLIAGTAVRVTTRRDAVTDGFWRTWSPTWNGPGPRMARVYWSVPPQGLAEVVPALARALPPDLPWLFKAGVDLGARGRPDAVVLYLRSPDVPELKSTLRSIYERVASSLGRSVPAFARPIAPGLAVAEDPPGEESFGEHRCRLAARAVASAEKRDVESLTGALHRTFAEAGLDLAAPDRRSRGAP